MLHRAPREHAPRLDINPRLNRLISLLGDGLGRGDEAVGFGITFLGDVVGEVVEVGVVGGHPHLMQDCGVDGGIGLHGDGEVVDVVD